MEREWSEEELNNTFSIYHDGAPAGWMVRDLGNLVFMEETSKK